MAYNEKSLVRGAPCRPSPSAIYNNLACSWDNLVYAHTRTACAITTSSIAHNAPVAVRRVESTQTDLIFTVRACDHKDNTLVVLGTEANLQVWDGKLSRLLHVWTIPEDQFPHPSSTSGPFVRGVAINLAANGAPHICFGTSNGMLHVLEISSDGRFKAPCDFPHHRAPITTIGSAYQSRRGRATDDVGTQLVTCDEEGQIVVWDAPSPGAYRVTHTMGTNGVPVVSVAVRGDLIVAGLLTGVVVLFGLSDGAVRGEIFSHARFMTTMDIHPAKDLIITGGEDAMLNVWTLPLGGQKASCVLSVPWLHAAVTGVTFCGPASDTIAAVAYDTDEVRLFKPQLV